MIDNRIEKIRCHVSEIMKILGIEKNQSNDNTPLRISKMWVNELFRNRNDLTIGDLDASMKVFDNTEKLNELIIIKEIEFYSTCEHHWLPFHGTMKVAYVPTKSIIGLSKIPRVVKYFSQKPQLQERLVKEIGDYLFETLNPEIIFIQAKATHDCVRCRGVESNSLTDTFYTKVDKNITEYKLREYKDEFFRR